MNKRNSLAYFVVLLLFIINQGISQADFEQRLNKLETRLDSLINALKDKSITLSRDTIQDSINLLYGIISVKGTLLDKGYFVINHNNEWKIPYWVAYYLSDSLLLGKAKRTNDFRPDPELAIGSRAELEDYRNSGYDRGHNAPAADFKRSREAMSLTFLLSNMSPQTPRLNRGIWENLEEQVREMVREKGNGWIITGNIFMAADSELTKPKEFIGANKVAVPTHCFKVILLRDQIGTFSMYAFLLPNQRDYIPGIPADYILKVDKLEEITGYDFFPLLDDSIENRLESIVPSTWPR
jgi:endonuclease G